jgi:hypothetical protein
MRRRQYAILGLLLGVLVFALSALANEITTATGTADCTGFAVTVNLIDLAIGTPYNVQYTVTLTCGGVVVDSVTDTLNFTATASTASPMTGTVAWTTKPTGSCTVTGTANLVQNPGSVTINFGGQTNFICGGTACPATIGFWKNEDKHPFPNSVQTSGLTIGGVTYSANDLLTILNTPSQGNAVSILGKQLVGALLNLAAGAKHNATADAAILTAEALLQANSLNLLTSTVDSSTTLGQALLAQEVILDAYNSADFNTCSENSGLMLGTP